MSLRVGLLALTEIKGVRHSSENCQDLHIKASQGNSFMVLLSGIPLFLRATKLPLCRQGAHGPAPGTERWTCGPGIVGSCLIGPPCNDRQTSHVHGKEGHSIPHVKGRLYFMVIIRTCRYRWGRWRKMSGSK